MHEFRRAGAVEPALTSAAPPRLSARLLTLSRAGEWWEHKLVPGAALLYATAYRNDAAPGELALLLLQFVAALAAGAAFVSALNDLADRDDDRRAGKCDRIGSSTALSWTIIAVSLAAGVAFLWSFADRPLLFWTYAAGWLAFSAYSLPPLRLKARAAAGIACDALGAHVVPALFAVALASGSAAEAAEPWLLTVCVWSLAYGLRGIIAHQLADEMFDRAAGLQTFVIRFGPHRIRMLVRLFLFPVELGALCMVLALIGSPIPIFALAFAALFVVAKTARFGLAPVLTGPAPRQSLALADFYVVFLPFSLLFALALREPAAILLIPAHVLLFPRNAFTALRDLARLPKEVLE